MYRKHEARDTALGIVVMIAIAAIIGSIGQCNAKRQTATMSAPLATVVAKIELTMETNNLHMFDDLLDLLYYLPDHRFNQQHRMIRLYAPHGFGTARLGYTDWFDVDSLAFNALKVDSTYHVAMWSDSVGSLSKGRAWWVVKLVRTY